MIRLLIMLALGGSLLGGNLSAQEAISPENLLEGLVSENSLQVDYLQRLQDLESTPVDVNRADVAMLLQIPFLNYQIARKIVKQRREKGTYRDAEHLREVLGVSEELISTILPYISFQTRKKKPLIDYRLQLGRPLHTIAGYEIADDARRYGNPYHLYHRLRWQPTPRLKFGALWEKDSGEPNWYDFGSFHIQYDWAEARSKILLGDFNLSSGQGLLFNGPYGSPVTVGGMQLFKRTPFRWQGKSAANESAFFRGALWEYRLLENTRWTVVASLHELDGTLSTDSLAFVRSFYTSGYHRNNSELVKRRVVKESMFATAVLQSFGETQLGGQFAHFQYSRPVRMDGEPAGKKAVYMGGFYDTAIKQLTVQGEISLYSLRYPALQQSVHYRSVDGSTDYGILFYYYHPQHWSLHGRAFGKVSSSPGNERGYLLSFRKRLFRQTELAAFFQVGRPQQLETEFPFTSRNQQFQIRQRVAKTRMTLRFTRRFRQVSESVSNRYAIGQEQIRQIRLQIDSDLSSTVRLRHRIERSWGAAAEALPRNYGFMIYQDLRYRPGKFLTLQARWTQFDVPDYSLRLYEFENDLPGNFRNALLNGRGFKWFLLVEYRPSKRWRMAVKYKTSEYPDEATLGSGLDETLGNRKQEIRGQLRLIF